MNSTLNYRIDACFAYGSGVRCNPYQQFVIVVFSLSRVEMLLSAETSISPDSVLGITVKRGLPSGNPAPPALSNA